MLFFKIYHRSNAALIDSTQGAKLAVEIKRCGGSSALPVDRDHRAMDDFKAEGAESISLYGSRSLASTTCSRQSADVGIA